MVRSGHPLIRGRLTLAQLQRSQHLLYQVAPGFGAEESTVEHGFLNAGIERRVAVRLARTVGFPRPWRSRICR